ncbi:voltage-dependent L-type calcium channel subunit beta-2 [Clonorchis sinensis]|uniref:Voltage-dependent L-type calcium channel subunit beta-2 n=1 Tax=Clonorchis sinensis TaxID=79923 RepID=G7YIC6_CLOSI|nr:voltage-dependent L-type calcium channel subunit beta-2 [Clonorchis sinensis]
MFSTLNERRKKLTRQATDPGAAPRRPQTQQQEPQQILIPRERLLSKQKSADSNSKGSRTRSKSAKGRTPSSRRSSESGESEEFDLILQAERAQLEEIAERELEAAKYKPVAFAVRTNISFDGVFYGADAPAPTRVISFEPRDFLHIKKRFDPHWWIGRLVRIGSPLGFIPSPAKLEQIHSTNAPHLAPQNAADLPATSGAAIPPHLKSSMDGDRSRPRSLLYGSADDRRGPVMAGSRQVQPESSPPIDFGPDAYDDQDDYREGHGLGASPPDVGGLAALGKKQTQIPGMGPGVKRKVFSKKPDFVAPYEVVPCMRPVVFVGPALKGYEVTDMMQKAIFDAMKKHFDGRIIVSRVSTNISLAKRVGALLHLDKKNVMERGRGRHLVTLLEVQQDLERIFHLASKMQLLLLDCDTINHPSQISKTCLAPIVIYIKINSIRVLNRLIKNRGKEQKKNAGVQTAAAEKLLQCPPDAFEFVVDQNTLGAATDALRQFLEGYWAATHPISEQSKAERILGADPIEPDSDRPLVPMTPGHPGLSVVTKSALDAGFTSQEVSALTGARAAGWATESGIPAENELGLTGVRHGGSFGGDAHGMGRGVHGNKGAEGDVEEYGHQSLGEGDMEGAQTYDDSPRYGSRSLNRQNRLQVGAAHAAAVAAMTAGLVPKGHTDQSSTQTHNEKRPTETSDREAHWNAGNRSGPGLAMGLASGVAATINAALFQGTGIRHNGPLAKNPTPSPTVAAAAAAAAVRPPPLKDLGIHQVECTDGTHVYQSRSARQAKQREAELERVRREAEAKVRALQSTVGGRRRRKVRDRKINDGDVPTGGEWNARNGDGSSLERPAMVTMDSTQRYGFVSSRPTVRIGEEYDAYDPEYFVPGGNYPGTGPTVQGMSRACPPDD